MTLADRAVSKARRRAAGAAVVDVVEEDAGESKVDSGGDAHVRRRS